MKRFYPSNLVLRVNSRFSRDVCGYGQTKKPERLSAAAVGAALCLVLALMFPPFLSAQEEEFLQPPRDFRFSVAAAPFYQFEADIDGGGRLSIASYHFGADVTKQLTRQMGIGLGVVYELDDYRFSGVKSIPVAKPWGEVQRVGVNVPIFFALSRQWRLMMVPTAQYSGEFGARFSDSIVYGGVVSATYAFGPDAYIGLGVGGFSNIEDFTVFPYVAINWPITAKLRLCNTFPTSPAGPAGLRLSYAINQNWGVGIGGAYRLHRFRLDKDSAIPNGVGEYSRIPVFAHLSYNFTPDVMVNFYAGVSLSNKIKVQTPNGDDLFHTKHDPAPLVGLAIKANL